MFNWISNIFKHKTKEDNKKMLFDVEIYTEDEGQTRRRTETGVQASSPKELIGIYAMCGERVKIIRQYNTDGSNANGQIYVEPANIKGTTNQIQMPTQVQVPVSTSIQNVMMSKPKFFKVAGIDCKLENNKLYQKQWLKLSPNEVESYRVIQDSTNKIVSLMGKHIEKLTWVLVDDETTSEAEAAE